MTTTGTAKVALPTDEQILITREFDAPRQLVWQAWTTPELVMRWWSGHRGAMTSAEIDLRVGGAWRYVMQASAGFEVAFHGEFLEVVPGERLVHTEVFEGMPESEGGPAIDTVTFAEVDGRTLVELLMALPTRAERDMVLESGMETGMQEQLDLLEELAATMAAA